MMLNLLVLIGNIAGVLNTGKVIHSSNQANIRIRLSDNTFESLVLFETPKIRKYVWEMTIWISDWKKKKLKFSKIRNLHVSTRLPHDILQTPEKPFVCSAHQMRLLMLEGFNFFTMVTGMIFATPVLNLVREIGVFLKQRSLVPS